MGYCGSLQLLCYRKKHPLVFSSKYYLLHHDDFAYCLLITFKIQNVDFVFRTEKNNAQLIVENGQFKKDGFSLIVLFFISTK